MCCSIVIWGCFFLNCFWEVACVSITFLFLLISLCGKCLPLWDCMFWFVKLFRFLCVRWSWTFFCPVIICLYALSVKSPLMSNFRNRMAFSYLYFCFVVCLIFACVGFGCFCFFCKGFIDRLICVVLLLSVLLCFDNFWSNRFSFLIVLLL